MKRTMVLAAGILIATSLYGYAAPRGMGMGAAGGRGASEFSPGDQMRESGGPRAGSHGASEFSPGDRMRDSGGPRRGSRGASEFSPGDRRNDMRHR